MFKHIIHLLILISFVLLFANCSESTSKINTAAQGIYSKTRLADPLPPTEFKSDGCSYWPDNDWLECCVEHDLIYWMGGTRYKRKGADKQLKQCVYEHGHPIVASFMYFGVRVGGVWWLPTSFRWGFGWDYPQSGPPNEPY